MSAVGSLVEDIQSSINSVANQVDLRTCRKFFLRKAVYCHVLQ